MAKRYGGKYSPDGKVDVDAPEPSLPFEGRRSTVGARINFLFIVPLPLIWNAFRSEPIQMAQYLAALALMLLAAWLTREGLLAEEAYNARKVARRPAFPRKIFGAGFMALGLAVAGVAGHGPAEAILFGALGFGLHLFSFGLDPLRSKGLEGVDQFQQDRVSRAVETAEDHLTAMTRAISDLGDRQLEGRVDRFQAQARKMFRTVEEDPRDLTAARKFMGVYLQGARDASLKFASLYAKTRDAQTRTDFVAFLDDLEDNFAAKTDKLLANSRTDMDIEIKVLRDRLSREGLVVSDSE